MPDQRALQVKAPERRLPVVQLRQPSPDVSQCVRTPMPGAGQLGLHLVVHQSAGQRCGRHDPHRTEGLGGRGEVPTCDGLARGVHGDEFCIAMQAARLELDDQPGTVTVARPGAIADGVGTGGPRVASPTAEASPCTTRHHACLVPVDEEEQIRQRVLRLSLPLPQATGA